ncbi:MAG: hypothetical protein ACI9QD_000264 [Thermoproteota archaeon]
MEIILKKLLIGILVLGSFTTFARDIVVYDNETVTIRNNQCERNETPIIELRESKMKTTITSRCLKRKCTIELGIKELFSKAVPNRAYYALGSKKELFETFPAFSDMTYNDTWNIYVQKKDKTGKLAAKARRYIQDGKCSEVSWSWRSTVSRALKVIRITEND